MTGDASGVLVSTCFFFLPPTFLVGLAGGDTGKEEAEAAAGGAGPSTVCARYSFTVLARLSGVPSCFCFFCFLRPTPFSAELFRITREILITRHLFKKCLFHIPLSNQ